MTCFEDEPRNGFYHGQVYILCADGGVWFGDILKTDNALMGLNGKKVQSLDFLPEEYPDKEKMAAVWRMMFMKREEHQHFEMMGHLHLERLAGK